MANDIQKEIKKLMEIPGKVRGQVFLTDFGYIKEKKGEEGTELLKKKIKEWGNLIDYEKIKISEWYPVGLRAVSLLVIKETFNWRDKEITEMGRSAPKLSFVVKMLMKTFISLKKSFREAANYWKKHYLIGELVPTEIDEEKKRLVLRLSNFKLHPIFCIYLCGYFSTIAQMSIKSEKITIEETKCVFKGNSCHEFLIKWE